MNEKSKTPDSRSVSSSLILTSPSKKASINTRSWTWPPCLLWSANRASSWLEAQAPAKSHIAKALLLIGCTKLYRCRYTTAANMLKDLLASLADGTLEQKLKLYTRPDILLIDEVGFDRLEQESARNASLFFKVIDQRYCKASTLLTTNIDFKALGDYLGDPVITTAIVDRMVHHSIIINIQGPSWRMNESKKLNASSKNRHAKTADSA